MNETVHDLQTQTKDLKPMQQEHTEMNTAIIPNNPLETIHNLGIEAIKQLSSSNKSGAKAQGLAIYALFKANELIFECYVQYEKDKEAIKDTFTLTEYFNKEGATKADGTRDNKLVNARMKAISEVVFGVAEPQPAHKTLIYRALDVAMFFINEGYTEEHIKLSKQNNLIVPYHLMNKEPNEKASENEQARWDKLKDTDHVIDGTKDNNFTTLARKAKPEKEVASRQGENTSADSNKSRVKIIKGLTKDLKQLNDEEAEGDVPAITESEHTELHVLFIQLTKYFGAEEEEVKKAQGRKQKAA